VNAFESIVERRIQAAREAGLFDDLAGRGQPIADIDRQRPPGWWAARLVRRERSELAADELDSELRAAMARLWRLGSEAAVRARVEELNQRIDDHNRVTTADRRDRLEIDHTVEVWRRLGRARPERRGVPTLIATGGAVHRSSRSSRSRRPRSMRR
jgi:hypothetical protein